MKNLTPNSTEKQSNDESVKKLYIAPKLQRFGGLAELVQLRPDRGRDGETRWIDCTSGP